MAGILDGLFNGSPEQQGLMAAYSQLMQDSGPSLQPRGLYQSLGRGLSAGQEATQQARQQEQIGQMRGLQIKGAESDLAAQELARQRAQELQNLTKSYQITRGAQQQPQQAAQAPQDRSGAAMFQGLLNGQAPTVSAPGEQMQQPMGAAPGFAPAFDQAAAAQERFQYAQYLRANGRSDAAAVEEEAALKMMPEFDTTPRTANDASGKPFQYLVGKRGERKVLDGTLPREELKLASLGNRDEAYNPYELKVGQTFNRGLSPDAAASNALGYANLNVSKQRLAMDKQAQNGGGRPPPGYRWAANGSLEAIPGGPATKHAMASEGERKASTLLQRLQFSEAQLEAAVKDSPGAATPSLLAQGLRGIGAESAANSLTGESRQKVDAAQLDILDAALTLGTGAAYTKEQLEGYRKSYFPQIGDAPGTVADKQARLNNVIEAAKTAAGRAAPTQPSLPTAAASGGQRKSVIKGQILDGHRFKGGNPADPNAWEKL